MRQRWIVAVATLCVLATWMVSAGTAVDPEVTDPAGDANSRLTTTDIRKLWIQDIGGDTVEVHLQLEEMPFSVTAAIPGTATLSYYAYMTPYQPDGEPVRSFSGTYARSFLKILYNTTGPTQYQYYYGHTEPGMSGLERHVIEGPLSGRRESDQLVWVVPTIRWSMPAGDEAIGYRLEQIYTISSQSHHSSSTPVQDDRAPNTGYGRTFIFGPRATTTTTSPTSATTSTSGTTVTTTPTGQQVTDNSRGDPPSFAHYFPEPQNATYTYSWVANHDVLEFAYSSTHREGTAHIKVHDAIGALAGEATIDGSDDEGQLIIRDRPRGNWTVNIEYDDYVGGLSGTLRKFASQTTATTSTTTVTNNATTTTDGNQTTNGAPLKPKETSFEAGPWLLGGFLVAAIIVAVIIFLRR